MLLNRIEIGDLDIFIPVFGMIFVELPVFETMFFETVIFEFLNRFLDRFERNFLNR